MSTNWEQELDRAIDQRFDAMVGIRRHLHQHPEVSGEERETSFYLYQMFGDAGLDVRMGPDGRGVIADTVPSEGREASGLLALRADIDALRIHDEKDADVSQSGRWRDACLRARLSHGDRSHHVDDAVAA